MILQFWKRHLRGTPAEMIGIPKQRAANCFLRLFTINSNFGFEIRRGVAHGEMYTPKSLYRIQGAKSNRHHLLKFRKLRGQKYIRLNLPDLDSYNAEKLKEENLEEYFRTYLRSYGFEPTRPATNQMKYFMNCSDRILDPYHPPENDGSSSPISVKGFVESTKAKTGELLDKSKNVALRRHKKALNKIKEADADFDENTFGERALQIYVEALRVLQDRDEEKLHDLVTERIFPKMWDELELKTMRWQFVKCLEAPKVVHLRVGGESDEMMFGQATVRFHTQQKLAIYDQFGRLYMGNEEVARDVLEYVIFENFLSNQYGVWRIHGKILSLKSESAPVVSHTYRKPVETESDDDVKQKYVYKIDEKTMGGEEPEPGKLEKPQEGSGGKRSLGSSIPKALQD